MFSLSFSTPADAFGSRPGLESAQPVLELFSRRFWMRSGAGFKIVTLLVTEGHGATTIPSFSVGILLPVRRKSQPQGHGATLSPREYQGDHASAMRPPLRDFKLVDKCMGQPELPSPPDTLLAVRRRNVQLTETHAGLLLVGPAKSLPLLASPL